MSRSRIALWLFKRLDIEDELGKLLYKPLKGGAKYIFSLGFINLFLFVNQVLTGMFLMIYYVPSPDHAYDAVRFIQNEASYGNVVRGLHFCTCACTGVAAGTHLPSAYRAGPSILPCSFRVCHARGGRYKSTCVQSPGAS